MIKVVGCIILPTSLTKDQPVLMGCGRTDNFINLNLDIYPLKNGCVSLGADMTAQLTGETGPLTMTTGPSASHKSKFPVIELVHDFILGRPFLSYVAASNCWVPTLHGPVAFPQWVSHAHARVKLL